MNVPFLPAVIAVVALASACRSKAPASAPPPEPSRLVADGPAAPKPEEKSHAAGEKIPDHADEAEEHEELPTKIRLPPKVVKSAGIKTATVELDSLPATVDLSGEIIADPDRTANIAARVPGRIVDVRVKEGDRVKTGQLIASIESPALARARAVLTSAQARLRSATLNAARLKNLEAKSLASGQEVASAEAEAAALEAEAAAARQTLAAFGPGADQVQGVAARLSLRSPLTGFVLAREAVQGQTVDAEHVVAVVGDLSRAYFLGRLFEKDLSRVKVGASAGVRLNAYPGELFEGEVGTIGKQLDPTARTVTARILVRNHDDRLKVGLFGTARVVTGPAMGERNRVVVPINTVTKIGDKDVVFVLQPDGDYEVHPVTLGKTAGSRVEILSGLRQGERIVTDGVFTLKSAVLKSTFGEEEH